MVESVWLERQADISFQRLHPRVKNQLSMLDDWDPGRWVVFKERLEANFRILFKHYYRLYSDHYDFFFHLEDLLVNIGRKWMKRPDELKNLDDKRENQPLWFQSNQMVAGVCYVDLFAGDLEGIRTKIPYLKELGLTYLHLMPIFTSPQDEDDGGYAVSSYRDVDPKLGTMDQLAELAQDLRREGISLALDFIFNHTSDEHLWALRALDGESEYQEYYWMFPDRTMPDAYERHLREIFPGEHSGAFTYIAEIDRWVWTTFHTYQWDLNYTNPVVFNRMVSEMLFLANKGVEVLRLDAVAFLWKKLGTSCENLPEAHVIIQAFNAIARIAAPALLFKSEAIVHPDEVVKYIDPEECQLSYNPLLMALIWNSLATRQANLLNAALRERFQISSQCSWVNYVRCHDDIGWTFSDEDAARLHINPRDHRQFLNNFYTGRFEGSFARGLPFQENPKTGDARISGTCASLAGVESALNAESPRELELAIKRILLIHGIIMTIGGIPLIYLGDEIGILNDYSYRNDPEKARDSRWVHRPYTDWEKVSSRKDPQTVEGRVFQGLQRLIVLRKEHEIFAGDGMKPMDTGNEHVLGFLRISGAERVLVFCNFSEDTQIISANRLRLYGLSYTFTNIASKKRIELQDLNLGPYEFVCLASG